MTRTAIHIDGTTFRDRDGRAVTLRGVNFGGDCKVPSTPNGHSYLPTDFADHRTVSFVGRPAPLDEIDSHLSRMAHWGFNCLRLLTTWEAVEHAGPSRYDEAYLDYYAEVCRRAGAHGMHVVVDFHQDVWSRMSGGDGAPGWTFEAAGLDFTKFHVADAAHLMQANYDYRIGGRQTNYPVMSWGGNYRMPANGIMWTLFFAGSDFAPGATVERRNVQHWLQDHYLGAMRAVAERVADIDMVIGFDTLNEPGTGYVGHVMEAPLTEIFGQAWSALDGLAVAAGLSRTVPLLKAGGAYDGSRVMNPAGVSIWLPGRDDPFRDNGAWEIDSKGAAQAVHTDYFQCVDGKPVEMERRYLVPFFNRVADTVRAVKDDWLIFAEVDPFGAIRGEGFPSGCPARTVNASHWYDLTALVTKRFDGKQSIDVLSGKVRSGPAEIEDGYVEGLGRLKAIGDALNGGAPTLIGECGIPYDMNEAEAYRRWAEGARVADLWVAHTMALDLMYNALDRLLLSSTQWNYTVSNRNDAMIGDGWNQEDLSIWSADQVTDPSDLDSGGRALEGFCRPYARRVQGSIVSQRFDRVTGRYELIFDADVAVKASTEVYVPTLQYREGVEIQTLSAEIDVATTISNLLLCPTSGRVELVLQRKDWQTSELMYGEYSGPRNTLGLDAENSASDHYL